MATPAPSLTLSWFPQTGNGNPYRNQPFWGQGWIPGNPSAASGWNFGNALQSPVPAGVTGYDPMAAAGAGPVNLFPESLGQPAPGALPAVPAAAMPPGSTGMPVAPTMPLAGLNTPGTSYTGNSMGMQDGTNMGVNMPQSISGKSSAEIKADMARLSEQDLAKWQLGIGAGLGLLNFGLGAYSLYKSGQQGDFQMGLAKTNLANSISSYNTAQEDRVRGRYGNQTTDSGRAAMQAEIDKRSLKNEMA